MNKQMAIDNIVDYVLSQGHECDNYLKECKQSGENPLLLEENNHIYICAAYLLRGGNLNQVRKELINEEDIETKHLLECYERHPEMFTDELLDDLEVYIEESEDLRLIERFKKAKRG